MGHIVCSPPSGTNISVGDTDVTCEVFDMSGNKAECSFQVDVKGTQYSSVESLSMSDYFSLKS